jgi:carboxypeptidase Taq
MPDEGTETRGHQIGTVARLAQERFTSPLTKELIEGAEKEIAEGSYDEFQIQAVAQARGAYEISKRIPLDLVTELNALKTVSQQVWTEARKNDDFHSFAPYLEKMVALNQNLAEAIGYEEHPYDALLHKYEPGMTVARLHRLFGDLKEGLGPVLKRAIDAPPPNREFLTVKDYPIEQQRAFALEIVQKFGYDLNRGRLDVATHPFEISFTRQDVRITTRYNRNYPLAAIFGVFHEAGHGMYEQGADPAITRSVLTTDLLDLYAVAGTSYGMHESQSRLWENLVGRSRTFWKHHLPVLRSYFPEQLNDVDEDDFYRAVNKVEKSLVRVEADELTYNFHIMLRVEIEIGLIEGKITVRELPELWKAKMLEYLGVIPPNDTLGVLQDIHWSAGLFGSFCTYTVGNVMSAQFYEAALKEPGMQAALTNADYRPLLTWLIENIYKYGRTFSPDQILQRSTGSSLNVKPYLNYIQNKYNDLFPAQV